MAIRRMEDLELGGRRVLVRQDLNVPLDRGRVVSDARLVAALPCLRALVSAGARVMVMSHLGRPEEGMPFSEQPEASLAPVAARLGELSGLKVRLVGDYLGGYAPGDEDLALFENVRVNAGESANDEGLARRLASLCDVFVMDAFATAHRAHASTGGVARFAPVACAGPLLSAELEALDRALAKPARPLLAVVGGSKVSSKLRVLDALAAKVDTLVLGGGIANTFLAAAGFEVGASLHEPGLVDDAKALLARCSIPLPTDVVVAKEVSADAKASVKGVGEVAADELILDVGPETAARLGELVGEAGTVLWNGPLGVAEIPAFAKGTERVAEAIAGSAAFTLAGGGDTLAVIDRLGISERLSYVSTGGGAFLEFVEGRELPGVVALDRA